MKEEKIIFQSKGIVIAEDEENPDYLKGTFCVCDFDINKNGVGLNRETIDNWLSTLVGSPLVGKISKNIKNKNDFTSHNMKIVSSQGADGKIRKKAVFDTEAFGVCTSAYIDTSDDGNDYIYATYRIWKRFENACSIIKERAENLHTSWEIVIEDAVQKVVNGKIAKIINSGRFIGLALLSENTEPAYDSSGLLEVASNQDNELNTALMEDLENLNISSDITKTDDKEVKVDMEKDNVVETNVSTEKTDEVVEQSAKTDTKETQQEKVDNSVCKKDDDGEKTKKSECDNGKDNSDDNKNSEVEKSEDITETSALTENDIRRKIETEIEQFVDENGHRCCGYIFMLFPADNIAWFREYGRNIETELIEVKYTVENDIVTITERNPVVLTVSPREINQVIAQKDSAIVEMSAQIQTLTDTIATLKPYKEKVDAIEKAEREAQLEKEKKELSEYAISSGYITQEEIETSEEIKGYIDNLDKSSIKSLIADRVVASLTEQSQQQNVETSDTKCNTEQPNVQINLSAEQGENTKDNSLDYALNAIKSYIGR